MTILRKPNVADPSERAPRQLGAEPGNDPAARVVVIDDDRSLFHLLEETLAGLDCVVMDGARMAAVERVADLIIINLTFPRERGVEILRGLASEFPGTPVLALSACFCSNVHVHGEVANRLGVAAVLPKPFTQETLTQTVHRLLARRHQNGTIA